MCVRRHEFSTASGKLKKPIQKDHIARDDLTDIVGVAVILFKDLLSSSSSYVCLLFCFVLLHFLGCLVYLPVSDDGYL